MLIAIALRNRLFHDSNCHIFTVVADAISHSNSFCSLQMCVRFDWSKCENENLIAINSFRIECTFFFFIATTLKRPIAFSFHRLVHPKKKKKMFEKREKSKKKKHRKNVYKGTNERKTDKFFFYLSLHKNSEIIGVTRLFMLAFTRFYFYAFSRCRRRRHRRHTQEFFILILFFSRNELSEEENKERK